MRRHHPRIQVVPDPIFCESGMAYKNSEGHVSHGTSSSFKNTDRSLRTACIHRGDACSLRRISFGVQLHDLLLSAAISLATEGSSSAVAIDPRSFQKSASIRS